jgi:hypothetical protein
VIACIHAEPAAVGAAIRYSLCRRQLAWNEYAFTDARHAARFYAGERHGLRACAECVEVQKVVEELEGRRSA